MKSKGHWTGDRKQTTLWTIPTGGQDTETVHGTQKPVECMRRPMLNNSSPGQAVYDPFLGSGTTLIAAETTGRVCLGIEIDPLYVDVAVRRWQAFTGKQATLRADRRKFDGVAAERLPKAGRDKANTVGTPRQHAGKPSARKADDRKSQTRRPAPKASTAPFQQRANPGTAKESR